MSRFDQAEIPRKVQFVSCILSTLNFRELIRHPHISVDVLVTRSPRIKASKAKGSSELIRLCCSCLEIPDGTTTGNKHSFSICGVSVGYTREQRCVYYSVMTPPTLHIGAHPCRH